MGSFDFEKDKLKKQLWDHFNDPKEDAKLSASLVNFISGKENFIRFDLNELDSVDAETIIDNAAKGGLEAVKEFLVDVVRNKNPSLSIEDYQIEIESSKIVLVPLHTIGSFHIGKIICVHGLVNRTSVIHPMFVKTVFRCSECSGESQPIQQESPWMLTKPYGKCKVNGCFNPVWEPVPELSEMIDSQEFMLQESYEDISSNRVPRTIQCITFKQSLLNHVNCGDDVDMVCLVRSMTALKKSTKSKFNVTYLEVLRVEKKRKDPESIQFLPEEVEQIKQLSKDPDIYKKMIDSLAPSLYGHNDEKEAILLAIFGSPEDIREDMTIRGNIHILMVGDPATAKSQLLRAAVELSPRGMYAMGRGTTAAGLTAALHKTDNSDEWEISAGVLVLADEGIACIDEIDKMREEDRVNIHEAMEQQTVTIDKAGVHAQLRARTAVIAAANPMAGRYDQHKSVFENLPKFPPSLFSRFDLIFKVLDIPNEEYDSKVVSHIIDNTSGKSPIDRKLLRKYIAFSKRIKPTLSSDAANALKSYFIAVRKTYTSDQKTFPFSYRQFEALKRLALARARSLLKEMVDNSDIDVVKRLFDVFLTDTVGGDVTSIETGQDVSQRGLTQIIMDAFSKQSMTRNDLRNAINIRMEDNKKFEAAFMSLRNSGTILYKGTALNGEEIFGLP
jgi:replicative DNA helicase Mcm